MTVRSNPLVSILIPAFNAERWIAQSIASAVSQSWGNREIIVVDDGSTDRTLAIARTFERVGVSVHRQRNHGAAHARNTALSLCNGEYIQWLDADDLLDADKIERQLEAINHSGQGRTLLSAGWGSFYTRSERARFSPTPLWEDLTPLEWLRRKMASATIFMAIESWLVSRELTEAAGPWDARLIVDDDGEYFCRVLLASNGTRFVPESRVRVRLSGSSGVSHIGRSPAKIEAQLLACQLHVKYIRSIDDSEATRDVCRRYLEKYVDYCRPTSPEQVAFAMRLLESVGGNLKFSELKWPYSTIKALFGIEVAFGARGQLSRLKHSLRRLRETMVAL